MPKLNKLESLTSTLESFIPDWTQIGMHTRIIELVNSFNNRYGMDVGVTNKLRWKPGIYDKIRESSIDVMFPKFKRKPANAFKWTEYSAWRMDRYRDDVHNIEKELLQCRQRGETLCTHIDLAKEKYYNWLNELNESLENLDLTISHLNVGHQLDGIHYRRGRYSSGNMISHVSHHMNEDGQRVWYDEMPRVTFEIDLMDIVIHYLKRMDGGMQIEFARIPFGNMTVHFEVNLYWWINNPRPRDRDLDAAITRYAHCYPNQRGVAHPYVKKDELSNYQNGNICFGDLNTSILKAIIGKQWPTLDALLHQWASTYITRHTTPLNSIEYHKVGVQERWIGLDLSQDDEDYETKYALRRSLALDNLPAQDSTCRSVFNNEENDYDTKSFVEHHCSTCLSQSACNYYNEELTSVIADVLDEFIEIFSSEGFEGMMETPGTRYGSGDRSGDLFIFDFNLSRNAREYLRNFNDNERLAEDGQDPLISDEELSKGLSRNIAKLQCLEELYQLRGKTMPGEDGVISRFRFGQINSHISLDALQDTVELYKLEHNAAVEAAERRRIEYDRL